MLIFNVSFGSYMYENGAGLLTAIITGLALAYSIISSTKGYEKKRENEQNLKNNKTLKMFDLLLKSEYDFFNKCKQNIDDLNIDDLNISEDDNNKKYKINFENVFSKIDYEFMKKHNQNKDEQYKILNVKDRFQYNEYVTSMRTTDCTTARIIENYAYFLKVDIVKQVENTRTTFLELLKSHHLNLNDDSLDAVNTKLNHLENLTAKLIDFNKDFYVILDITSLNDNSFNPTSHKNYNSIFDDHREELNNKMKEINDISTFLGTLSEKLESF
ncbi:MAG TPA: hypothetical protein DCO67_03470 [Staphylococcus sp.]|nr:hypothetical protein [Staphylococcus sp.]